MQCKCGITRTQDMRDLESTVSGWANQARLGKYGFLTEPKDKWPCVPFPSEGFLLQSQPPLLLPSDRRRRRKGHQQWLPSWLEWTGELRNSTGREEKKQRLSNVIPGEPNMPPGQPHGYKMRRTVSSLPVLSLGPSSPFLQPSTLSQGAHPGAPCIKLSANLQNRPPWPPTPGSPPPS